MCNKVLLVDDDPNLLAACRRQLYKRFELATAKSGVEGLRILAEEGPFALIVSDMRMPQMDGAQFLAKARETCPMTSRIMLTGNNDTLTAMKAVNEGRIFRFLNKPCQPEDLTHAIEAGIEQYRLLRVEKDMLERTLKGSISVLADVMALAKPLAFGRATRVRRIACSVAARLKIQDHWQVELAAMLSQIGCISVAEEILKKAYQFHPLSSEDQQTFQSHPVVGSDLVARIPRLEPVADIILHQERQFDGRDATGLVKRGEEIPLGARILKPALDYDALLTVGNSSIESLMIMEARTGWYDPHILEIFKQVFVNDAIFKVKRIPAREIYPGAMLAHDLKTTDGLLLLAKGQEITGPLCTCLKNLIDRGKTIPESVFVLVPEVPGAENVAEKVLAIS